MKKNTILYITIILVILLLIVTIFVYNNSRDNHEGTLTLETVRNLVSKKGEFLTWSDFENYPSTEVGSGLHILLYEIDQNYSLRIGGIPNETPMYVQLLSKNEPTNVIDIRYDNIDDLLDKNN